MPASDPFADHRSVYGDDGPCPEADTHDHPQNDEVGYTAVIPELLGPRYR
jgi:hypothetical protein